MASEKRLIDANALMRYIENNHSYAGLPMAALVLTMELLTYAPTVDAVEVVYCDNCVNHGKCYPENIFRLARIEKPYCCVGKRDGDGNG